MTIKHMLLLLMLFLPKLAQSQDSLSSKNYNIFSVPLQPEEINLGVEWADKTGRSHTLSLAYVYQSAVVGPYFIPRWAPTLGFAARYGYRMKLNSKEENFSNEENFQGWWHGPLLMYKWLQYRSPADFYPFPPSHAQIISAQYMLGVQRITRSGLSLGAFTGAGIRLKFVNYDHLYSAPTYGINIMNARSLGLVYVAPSVHLNVSIGYAF